MESVSLEREDSSFSRLSSAAASRRVSIVLQHHKQPGLEALLPELRALREREAKRGCDLRLVTMVRDPVERAISGYLYLASRLDVVPALNATTLDFYLDAAANAQTRYVLGSLRLSETWAATTFKLWMRNGMPHQQHAHEPLLSRATTLLDREADHVGRTEDIKATFAYLSASLGAEIRPQVSRQTDLKLTRRRWMALERMLGANLQLITDSNQVDEALYRHFMGDDCPPGGGTPDAGTLRRPE